MPAPRNEDDFRSGGSLSPLMGPGPILDPLAPNVVAGPRTGWPMGEGAPHNACKACVDPVFGVVAVSKRT